MKTYKELTSQLGRIIPAGTTIISRHREFLIHESQVTPSLPLSEGLGCNIKVKIGGSITTYTVGVKSLEAALKEPELPSFKKAPKYVFTEIPNDEEGAAFVAQMRQYLNKDRYRLRVRGQHLKPGLDWRKYERGQPIDCSTHLRVYVEEL